ncbi:hypothetical protein [Cryobacterium tagatosivorans]|nr:hypothetical protein [Cryobacterium tagatosivorans]
MRRISYGAASFLTTSTVADALFPLVAALSASHTTLTLEIPAVNTKGKTVIVKMLAGPTSELISIPEESPWDRPDTKTAVAYLLALTQAVLSAPPRYPFIEATAFTDFEWDDMGHL